MEKGRIVGRGRRSDRGVPLMAGGPDRVEALAPVLQAPCEKVEVSRLELGEHQLQDLPTQDLASGDGEV
jgi:hypothetical protein